MTHTSLALLVVIAGSLSQCATEGDAENARNADAGAADSATSAATIVYEEDTRAFANPERGFFHGRGRTQEQPPSNAWPGLNKSDVPVWRDTENVRVITQYYHLDPYKQSDIPAEYLAVLEDERDFEIVARNQATGAEYFLQAQGNDPRLWLPAEVKTVRIVGGIPGTGVPEGTYDLLAFLPDPAPNLRNAGAANRNGDPAVERWSTYAIRLANRGVWEEITGYNDLGLDLTVTAAAGGADYSGGNWFVSGPAGP